MRRTTSDSAGDDLHFTNLHQPLFDGAQATERDLVEYLDGVRDRILPVLEDRPLSVIRVHRGQVEEGQAIPVARVQAMHEGKRRARAARAKATD